MDGVPDFSARTGSGPGRLTHFGTGLGAGFLRTRLARAFTAWLRFRAIGAPAPAHAAGKAVRVSAALLAERCGKAGRDAGRLGA